MNDDKAGKAYWDEHWAKGELPSPINPRDKGVLNYANRRLHEYFLNVFSNQETRGKALLEVGCARSAWLPYFAETFGFRVYGIDYSEAGCSQARQVLAHAGIDGEVVCTDFFSPPATMLEAFGVVVSLGVVEHFADTMVCLRALARFLKPGATMITIIPNMVGWIGFLNKVMNPRVYEIHVPLDPQALAQAHLRAGLQVVDCRYFLSNNFAFWNLNGLEPGTFSWRAKRIALAAAVRFTMLLWAIEEKLGPFKPNRLTSPYINCVARKVGSN